LVLGSVAGATAMYWFLSMDGISPTWFDPDSDGSSLELEVTFNLTPVMQDSRTVEAGLFVLERPFPATHARLTIKATGGRTAC
jgi:hypothetical protein